jgi:hypothetical protein
MILPVVLYGCETWLLTLREEVFENKMPGRITIIIIFLHGLGRLTCSGIDELPSFPGASTVSSSSRFVVEGVFRESGVVHSFRVVDPVLFVFEYHVLYCLHLAVVRALAGLDDLTGYAGGNFRFLVGPPKPDRP